MATGGSCITFEDLNYHKVVHLLIGLGTKQIRSVFDQRCNIASSTTAGVLQINKQRLQTLRKIINVKQWQLMYPTPPATANSQQFDITLLMILLRNICGLKGPKDKVWTQTPISSDVTLEADLVRMREFRNKLQHIAGTTIGDSEFQTLWVDISVVLVRLGAKQSDIDELKSASMDPSETQDYKQKMTQWIESDYELKEQLDRIQEKQDRIEEKLDKALEKRDMQSSVGGDVTASSEKSPAAAYGEMARAMEDPEGDPTSLQHHIDTHSSHHVQYTRATNVLANVQSQVQEQADGNTGPPPRKRHKSSAESPCPDESEYPAVVVKGEQDLKFLYKRSSKILPFPWFDGTNRLENENVYIELELEMRNGEKSELETRNGEKSELEMKNGEKRDFSRQEIFSSRKKVLIEGNPGYGKSTFCTKLTYDWAKGDTEYLNRFKLMFHFKLTDFLHCNAQSIKDAIFELLLKDISDDSKRQELWNFVESNQEKVCFVFDGLDEVPTKNLPPYFKEMIAVNCCLPYCPVIVTSRKIRDKNPEQRYDTILSIKGFDYEKAKSFIEKHMNEMKSLGADVKASDFLQELEKSNHKGVLIDFMQSPLNTLMLCDTWIHSKKLPHTRTKLYEEIIHYVEERYRASHDDCDPDFKEEINKALLFLGEMSYRGLTTHERNVYFSEKDISRNKFIRELGLLTKVSEFPDRYGFYHLTFQEYFASVYLAHLFEVDKCKFVDAIALLSQERGFVYNKTVFAFLGGKLQDNVDEIFKAMKEKGIVPSKWSNFDPREILYESCCKSTSVIEHCAEFLPIDIMIDLDTMDRHSNSNRLTVNTTLLQCPRTRSRFVFFKLKVKADEVAMYRECYEALQKNSEQFAPIDVHLTVDLNDCKVKGGYYIEEFTFINNTQHQSLPNLNPLHISSIKIEISSRIKSANAFTNHHLTEILKSLSPVSAHSLSIFGLPLGNLTFIRGVIEALSSNKIVRRISMSFCNDCADDWSIFLLKIQAEFGNFCIYFQISKMDFKLLELQKSLSTLASANNKKLSLKVSTCRNFNTEVISHVTDVVDKHGGVDIDPLILIIKGSRDSNSSIEEATLKVSNSAREFDIRRLPGSLDLMKEVFNYLNGNNGIGSISIVFGERRFHDYQDRDVDTSNITTHLGKFYIDYNNNMMEFDLADLHSLRSTFTAVEKESIPLNVEINSDLSKKTADILRRLQSADLEQLEIITRFSTQSHLDRQNKSIRDFWSNEGDMYTQIRTIVEELSRVSAKELNIESLPLGDTKFMNHVLSCLRNNQRLGFVSLKFCEMYFDTWSRQDPKMNVSFGKLSVSYDLNAVDFKLADLHALFSTSVSGNERESPDVSLKCYLEDGEKFDISEVLSKLESVEIGKLSLHIDRRCPGYLKKEDFHFSTASRGVTLSRVSASKLFIVGLPVGNLEFIRNVLDCLSCCKLLETVDVIFCHTDPFSGNEAIKIDARIGKFHLLFRMNYMDFNLLSLCQLLTQCLSFDNNDVTFNVTVNYDFNKSTKLFEKFTSVTIAKMSLHIPYGMSYGTDIYSRTSDMLQSLSMINAKSFVIEGLPHGNAEFTESVHTDLEKSVCDKVTHLSFRPPCCRQCKMGFSRHTTVTARNQKHIYEFCFFESKLDIVGLYEELHKELSTHDERFLMDVQIYKDRWSSNIEDDIQCILAASKSIMFNKIEYVEESYEMSPAIDVLEKLTDVNTRQLSYKSNYWFGYKLTKSVVNTMLQCQSAQTFAVSLVQEFNDIKISENIDKLVNDGIIIRGVKLFGSKLAIQGTYVEKANTVSKVIEVEFNVDQELGTVIYKYLPKDESNMLTNMYMKIVDGLQTISELKSLCIELTDLDQSQTFYPCKFTSENIMYFVLALPYLTNVTIVGGKIISTDNSSKNWTDLCCKESLQMLTFEGCDLNSSCQSVIDSFSKADELRCSQLRIILSDSLYLRNMNLMKDMLLSKGLDLNDACGSVSQGETVFSLKGKSVSISASYTNL